VPRARTGRRRAPCITLWWWRFFSSFIRHLSVINHPLRRGCKDGNLFLDCFSFFLFLHLLLPPSAANALRDLTRGGWACRMHSGAAGRQGVAKGTEGGMRDMMCHLTYGILGYLCGRLVALAVARGLCGCVVVWYLRFFAALNRLSGDSFLSFLFSFFLSFYLSGFSPLL
jgi:hypothetical protein